MFGDSVWYILGAGSVGSLWALGLGEAGYRASFLVRPKYVRAPRFFTLTVKDTTGATCIPMLCIPTNKITGTIDRLIITVKAAAVLDAVQSIKYALDREANVILLVNGLGIQQQVVRILPPKCRVWFACTTHGAWREELFKVYHAGKGATWLGPGSENASLSSLPLINITRLATQFCHNIDEHLWHKVAINSVINGLTALYQCKNGRLLENNTYREQVSLLAKETHDLLQALSINMPQSVLDMSIMTLEKTANNYSSTLQDIWHKRATELPWINGFLLSEANKIGVELPTHRALAHQLKKVNIW